MSQAPSMPMFWDAYLADTTHLTTEEHGAYLLLLAAMWRRNGWVPDDDRDNARILGLTPAKWKRVKERLSVFLIFQDGQITQKNLLKIWKITQEKIEKNRENGAKGGRPKSNKNNNIAKANGSVSQKPNETIPEPEPEPNIKERDTNVSLALVAPCEPDRFSEFWNQYPHRNGAKKGKAAAEKAWAKAIKARASPSQIIAGALRYANDRQVIQGYAKDPATWLNAKGWEDDIEHDTQHGDRGNGSSGRGGSDTGMVAAFAAVAARRAAQSGRG